MPSFLVADDLVAGTVERVLAELVVQTGDV
jgi:hypothetical protein